MIATPTGSYFGYQKLIKEMTRPKFADGFQVSRQVLMTRVAMGVVFHSHSYSCFFYQKLIEGPTRLKFGMCFPSNQVGVIKHVGAAMGVIFHSHTHRKSFCLSKANEWTKQAKI